jgi:hypothetical protein
VTKEKSKWQDFFSLFRGRKLQSRDGAIYHLGDAGLVRIDPEGREKRRLKALGISGRQRRRMKLAARRRAS